MVDRATSNAVNVVIDGEVVSSKIISSNIEFKTAIDVEVIEIAQLDKYIVTVEVTTKNTPGLQAKLQQFSQHLEQWWLSDEKFMVIIDSKGDAKVKFQKLEKSDDEN